MGSSIGMAANAVSPGAGNRCIAGTETAETNDILMNLCADDRLLF